MNGHCLCGCVRFTAPDIREIGVCHCGFCRRWGGGPLLAVHCGKDVAFEGVDHKPPHYTFANRTPMFIEQQVIARFAPPPKDGGPA